MQRQTKYEMLFRKLEAYLDSLEVGERLISVRDMREKFGVSLATLNSALQLLENAGMIQREPYRGIYKSRRALPVSSGNKSVVLLLPGWSEPLFLHIITACSRCLHSAGLKLNLCVYDYSESSEASHLKELLESEQPEGILYMPTFDTSTTRMALKNLTLRCPVVQIDRYLSGDIAPFVSYASFEASFTATEQLILAGCRRIGLVTPHTLTAALSFKERLDGFHAALAKYGLHNDQTCNIYFDSSNPKLSTDLSLLMQQDNPPDGFFCCNMIFLPMLINQLTLAGYSIPGDVAVTTFDLADEVNAVPGPCAMTYVREMVNEVAASAVQLLLQMVKNPGSQYSSQRITCPLVAGESCPVNLAISSV